MKIVLVNYLNSRPFLRGLQTYAINNNFEIIQAYPSQCAQILRDGNADAGLVPIGALHKFETYRIIGDYCIGCDGEVKTVAIYSHSPLEECHTLHLDYQSMTSIRLAQILLNEYWHKEMLIKNSQPGYEKELLEREASVIIGDRTAEADNRYEYKYDLGLVWKKLTGLPFCFAAWISLNNISDQEIDHLNKALKHGLDMIPQIITEEKEAEIELNSYFHTYIDFKLDKPKMKAIQLFNKKLEYAQAHSDYR